VDGDYSIFDFATQTVHGVVPDETCYIIDEANDSVDFSNCCPIGFSVVSVDVAYNPGTVSDPWLDRVGSEITCLEDI
jgi:hypothetical protein